MPEKSYIASKVSINQGVFSTDAESKIKAIPYAISSRPIVTKGKWNWQFASVRNFNTKSKEFVIGYLTKFGTENHEIVEAAEFKTQTIEHERKEKVFFAYEPIFEILMFEKSSKIKPTTFYDIFCELVYKGNTEIGAIAVYPYSVSNDIYARIMQPAFVTKIEFEIIPKNRYDGSVFNDFDALIDRTRAKNVGLTLESDEGINRKDKIIQDGIQKAIEAAAEVKVNAHDIGYRTDNRGAKKPYKIPKNFNSKTDAVMQTKSRAILTDDIVNDIIHLYNRALEVSREENPGDYEIEE